MYITETNNYQDEMSYICSSASLCNFSLAAYTQHARCNHGEGGQLD